MGSCPCGELSWWGVVLVEICPSGELSWWGLSWWGVVLVGVIWVGVVQWGVVLEPTSTLIVNSEQQSFHNDSHVLSLCTLVKPHGAEVGPALPSSAAPPTTQPPIVIPQGPANCDFEGGPCSYTQNTDDNFDWTRQRGRTDSDNTGPDYDHTHKGTVRKYT